jgi:hypothetical protein
MAGQARADAVDGRSRRIRAGLAGVAGALVLFAAGHANAAVTFGVNDVGDGSDIDLSDFPPTCDASADPGIHCTLRAAIQEANSNPGSDQIHFDFAGSGVHTISPAAELPPITDQVVIDGYTQSGASSNTTSFGRPLDTVLRVELSGGGAPAATRGLAFEPGSSGSAVRGLVVNEFTSSAIYAGSSVAIAIEGNFVGTDPSGRSARPNSFDGIFGFGGSGTTVGGVEPADRNLISGNGRAGVGSNDYMYVRGNYIGTTANGRSPLGNGEFGVNLYAATTPNAVTGNVIAHNSVAGVRLLNASPGSPISRNSIFRNGIGIDLNGDGVTLNDQGDMDPGPNGLQNTPVVKAAKTTGRATKVRARLHSSQDTQFLVEFFSNPVSERGGRTFIGQKQVTTTSDNDVTFAFKPRKRVRGKRRFITATATALGAGDGATSEFSAPRKVKRPR